MLYSFLYPLRQHFGPFRVFGYLSFRAAGAAVTALLVAFVVGPMIVRWLQHMQIHQVVREGTPDSHASKGRTPTMGGMIILAATLLPTLLWMRLEQPLRVARPGGDAARWARSVSSTTFSSSSRSARERRIGGWWSATSSRGR